MIWLVNTRGTRNIIWSCAERLAPPLGKLRESALQRVGILDCTSSDPMLASCDPSLPLPPEAVAWRTSLSNARVDHVAYTNELAAVFKQLVCSGEDKDSAGYVLRGLLHSARLAATGTQAPALIDFIMSKDCPVSTSLTDADKASLLRIKQDATKPGG